MAKEPLRFVQIISAPWKSKGDTLTHSIYGLSEHGVVYKLTKNGWTAVTDLTAKEPADEEAF